MIIHGDCLDIMPTLANKSVDLVVTSPPYDTLRNYNGNYLFPFEEIAKELFRVTKDGGVVVWVVGDATINGSETGTSFKQALFFMSLGFKLHDSMIYAKNNYMPLTHNRYEQQFEYMFVFSKGKPKVFNPMRIPCISPGSVKYRGNAKQYENSYSERKREERTATKEEKYKPNIWFYNVGNSSKNDRSKHNAPFPLQLATDHILSWSNEGDTVLDPFAGSGTTGVACLNTGRKFILIEKDASYCEIIRKRIENHEPLLQAVNV
jgi:DNA modification methylase